FVGGLAMVLKSTRLPILGSRLPLIQGQSFASVSTILAFLAGGDTHQDVFGDNILASGSGILICSVFSQLVRCFSSVVSRTVITAVGLTLFPVAADWAMGGDDTADDYGSMMNIGLAVITFIIIMIFSKVGVATLSRLSILLGLVVGTIIAVFMGRTDFSDVGDGMAVAFPKPFEFDMPTFDIAAILSMLIVILVVKTETTADII